jgi:MFS family permease
MSAAPGVQTQDRPCADGLEQSALRLHRRAVPREAAFWLVGYVFSAVILGTALPVPLYAIYQRQWHFSSGVLTLIFAVYAVAVLATLLLAGQASDQVGRKPVLAAALSISVASTVVFIFAASPAWLYPARILSGVSAGLMTGAATAALSEMVQASASRRASMVATTANSGAGALGPLMAGLFAQYLPQPTVLVFEVFLVFLGAAALALAFIPETVTRRERLSLRFTGLAIPAEGRGEFIAAGVAAFAAYALNGLFASLVPGFTTVMLHHPDYAVAGGVTGLFFAAGAVAALGLAPFNSRPVLLGGLGLFLVGLALVVAGMSAASLALFLVGAVVAGSAFGALVIGSLSAANRLARPQTRAKVISTYFVFAYPSLSIPVVGVGVAWDYVGSFRAVLGCSIVLAGLCVFSAALGARAADRLSTELGNTERAPARLPSKNARCCEAAGTVIQDRGGPNDDRRPDTTAADPQHDPGSPRPAPLVAVPYPPGPRARHCLGPRWPVHHDRQQPGQLGDVRFLDPARPVRAARIGAGVVGAALADLAAAIDRGLPGPLRDQPQRRLLPLGQRPADRVGQLVAAAGSQLIQAGDQGVAGPGPVESNLGFEQIFPCVFAGQSCRVRVCDGGSRVRASARWRCWAAWRSL